jgi:hypothetical protein
MDSISINNEDVIAGEGSDILDWKVIRGNASVNFLHPGQTYVVKVIGYESSAQKPLQPHLDLRKSGMHADACLQRIFRQKDQKYFCGKQNQAAREFYAHARAQFPN